MVVISILLREIDSSFGVSQLKMVTLPLIVENLLSEVI